MSSISDPQRAVLAIAGHLGALVHNERVRRSWTLRELAGRAGVSVGMAHRVEAGGPASLETYVRLASALALRPSFELVDTRRRVSTARLEDPVHAAMGEVLAGRLASAGFEVALDEPYQHFQFAGRADVLAWSIGAEALLHIENRTRFPNQQEAFGSYNAKRRYLPAVMAQRLGLRRGWQAVSHAMVALWSAEALHAIRIRTASFRAVCPARWSTSRTG
jgi:transcriptional regulator with XRE-family HTH domain